MTNQQRHQHVRVGLSAKLLVAGLAMMLALVACEVAARMLFPAPPEPMREPQIYYQSDPHVGFLHVPSQRGWQDDGLATINAMGLRGAQPVVPKPEGLHRILAIGDSTTFGWGVDDNGTYPVQLEQGLKATFPGSHLEVVNGGVGAYDLRHAARLLRHFGPTFEPDIVVVGVYWNDLPYHIGPPDAPPQRASSNGGDGRRGDSGSASANDRAKKPFRLGNQPSGLNRVLRSSRLLYVLRQTWLGVIAPTDAADNLVKWEMALLEGRQSEAIDEGWEDIAATLAEMRELADSGGFELYVLIQPIRAQVEQSYPNAAYQSRVRAISEGLGLAVIDPLPFFASQPEPERLFIPYDRMHFTALGNAQVAAAALDALRKSPRLATAATH